MSEKTDLSDYLAQREAQRVAEGSPRTLDAIMAKISANVTAEAAAKIDHAAQYRNDIKSLVATVLAAARSHRNTLNARPDTPDKTKAMRDLDAFISEYE
jgi:hypothetical protein